MQLTAENKDKKMEHLKNACDGLAACGVIATLAGWMPKIAAFMSAIWYAIRFYEWIVEKYKRKS